MLPRYRLIDGHSHIEGIKDLDGAIEGAQEAGIVAIIGIGSDYESSQQVLAISRRYTQVKIYPATGIHPGNLDFSKIGSVCKLIEENIDSIVGIGEIGLDYWYKEVRKNEEMQATQKQVFQIQLDLAKKYKKPVIVHSRGAWEDCFEMVNQTNVEKAIFHWYSGPLEVLKTILDRGYFISATPAAEYSKEHRQVIRETPIENLLLETDSPVVYRNGERKYESQPRDLLRVLSAVSEIKGIEEPAVAAKTTENIVKFFSLDIDTV